MDCSSNKNNWQERTQYLEILQGKFSSRGTSHPYPVMDTSMAENIPARRVQKGQSFSDRVFVMKYHALQCCPPKQ